MGRIVRFALLAWVTLLAGCGFQLRGAADLPPEMAKTYIERVGGAGGGMIEGLTRALAANGATVVAERKQATAVLSLSNESTRKRTIVKGDQGTALEYELYFNVSYAVATLEGKSLVPIDRIELSRDLLYEEGAVLGRESGESLAVRDMNRDAVWAILRRLQAVARR